MYATFYSFTIKNIETCKKSFTISRNITVKFPRFMAKLLCRFVISVSPTPSASLNSLNPDITGTRSKQRAGNNEKSFDPPNVCTQRANQSGNWWTVCGV